MECIESCLGMCSLRSTLYTVLKGHLCLVTTDELKPSFYKYGS